MISRLVFSNFYSFAEETEISFELGKKPSASYYDINLENGSRLNKVIAIVGANGSGKTQLLKPLAFINWFMTKSFLNTDPKADIAFLPHKLNQDKPSTLTVEFYLNQSKYRYKLTITTEQVLHESLHKQTSHLYSYIFTRDLIEDRYHYKHKGFEFSKVLAEKTRGNVSLISAAYVHDSAVAGEICELFDANMSNIGAYGRSHFHDGLLLEAAKFFEQNPEYIDTVSQIISEADIGISTVKLEEVTGNNEKGEPEKLTVPFGIHKEGEQGFVLSFFEESNGTKALYSLLHGILPVLKHGGLAIIDELDNDLHAHLLIKLIELFKFEQCNPNNAQLIFSCHSHEVLNYLKKHQIYLVEKDQQVSEAWRLDEVVGLRADDNVYAKYQAGALGAIPNI